jgi:hypothetical protein
MPEKQGLCHRLKLRLRLRLRSSRNLRKKPSNRSYQLVTSRPSTMPICLLLSISPRTHQSPRRDQQKVPLVPNPRRLGQSQPPTCLVKQRMHLPTYTLGMSLGLVPGSPGPLTSQEEGRGRQDVSLSSFHMERKLTFSRFDKIQPYLTFSIRYR